MRVTGEIRDVQRKRRPEADHAGKARHEEREKLARLRLARIKRRRLRKNWPETASVAISPKKQKQTERDEERRFDIQEPANAIDSLVNDQHVDAPEKEKAEQLRQSNSKCAVRVAGERGCENRNDFVNRAAADPGLDSEPAAGNEGPHERRNVGAGRAERSATKNWKRNSVTRSSVRVQDDWEKDDEIAEKNCQNSLPPIHPAADERGSQHVGGNAGRHRNPERGETSHAPGASLPRHGREVAII